MTALTHAATATHAATTTATRSSIRHAETGWVGRLLAHRLVRTAAIAALPWAVIGASGCQNVTASSSFSQSLRQTAATKTAPVERMLLVADTYAKQGQTDRAAGLYARIVKTNPTHRRAVAGLYRTDPNTAFRLANADTLAQITGGVQLADLSQPVPPKATPAPATNLIAATDLPAPGDAPVRDAAPATPAAPTIQIAAAPVAPAASPVAPVAAPVATSVDAPVDAPLNAVTSGLAAAPIIAVATPAPVAAPFVSVRETPQPVDMTPPQSPMAATPAAAPLPLVVQTKGLINDALPQAISAEFETFGPIEPPPVVVPFGELVESNVAVNEPAPVEIVADSPETVATETVATEAIEVPQTMPSTIQPPAVESPAAVVAVTVRSAELVIDGQTVSDADYFLGNSAADAELGVDLAAAIDPTASADAAEPTQEVRVASVERPAADWAATASSELPQIKPLRTAALHSEPVDVTDVDESASESDVRWALADAGPDLSAIDVTGWTAATSGAKARGKKYATVPQLTALTIADEISTTQLLTAQAACESPSDEVRLAAAEAVLTHRASDETAWSTVDELLGKGESDIGTLSALMLGTLPDACHARTIPRLMDLLRTATPDVKSAAALALGGLGQTAQPAVPELRQLAQTDNACGRSARVSLECLGVEL